jgi:tetratricopeptide (TPR) repeat protein
MIRRTCAFVFLIVCCAIFSASQVPAATPDPDALTDAAQQAYRLGRYKEAADGFRAAIKLDPTSLTAQVGLIHSDLRHDQIDEASTVATSLITAYPNSAVAHAAMGDVLFRRAVMADAEKEFQAAIKLDKTEGRGYYGLARLYSSYSLHRKAYDFFSVAHMYSPQDADIREEWLHRLPRKQRLAEMIKSSAEPGLDGNRSEVLKLYIDQMKAIEALPSHSCKLANKIEKADIPLAPIMYNAKILLEWGLKVGVNDHSSTLVLDTGAGGITLSRKAAEKAGVVKLADTRVGGLGDEGVANPYIGFAKSIKIGNFEFKDCIVDVMDKNKWVDVDGLIGADVFSDYLVDIDFPVQTIRLSPLPKDPEGASETASLDTHAGKSETDTESTDPKVIRSTYHDRYVAPEMVKWSRFFRSGHLILLPTLVNRSPEHLFLVDTGASNNLLSNNFAREVTKVSKDRVNRVGGVSGEVKDVYTASKAELQFANFRTRDFDLTAIDLSRLSNSAEMEVSGIIGFDLLRSLEIKIDYRDGLIDFVYDRDKLEIKNLNNVRSFLDMH